MSKIEDQVIKKLLTRAEVGKSKYGVTMERIDLGEREWLIHAQEEALDLAVYLQKLITDFDKEEPKTALKAGRWGDLVETMLVEVEAVKALTKLNRNEETQVANIIGLLSLYKRLNHE